MDNKKQLFIIIALVSACLIFMMAQQKENFDVIQQFPFLPPKYWEPRPRKKYDPWWVYDNSYHPAVPQASVYDSSTYKFPPATKHLVGNNYVEEGFGFGQNNRAIILFVIAGLVAFWLYNRTQQPTY